jgi:prepilin-type N-terminal cleavage/methylation domain-containing protein
MEPHAMRYNNRNDKGFTLLELLIAMVILFIAMTAILDFVCTYQRININNTLRNEAIKVVESKIEQFRDKKWDDIADETTTYNVVIRNITVGYTLTVTVQDIGQAPINSRVVQVQATWHYGKDHVYAAQTIISADA